MNTFERGLWRANDGIEASARALRSGDGQKLFVFLASSAAELRWKAFTDMMAHVAAESEAKIETMLLRMGHSMAWSSAYSRSGMPPPLFPLFIKIVQTARSVTTELPLIKPGRHVRLMVIQKSYQALSARTRPACTYLMDELLK
jgi:hypothetical protein